MAQIDLKKAIVTLAGGSGAPTAIEIKIAEGDVTWTEKQNVEYTLNRGSLTGAAIRLGDEEPVEVRIDATWEYIAGKGSQTVADAIKGKGDWAGFSSSTDPCEPYAVDIIITYSPGCGSGSGESEVITLADFRYESLDFSLSNGTISVSGRCNILEAAITPPA